MIKNCSLFFFQQGNFEIHTEKGLFEENAKCNIMKLLFLHLFHKHPVFNIIQ